MTFAELQKEALGRSAKERAVLASLLRKSLEAQAREDAEMEALGTRLRAEMSSWFDGPEPSVDWTDEDWDRLMRGERRTAAAADSWALPQGSKPR